MFVWTVHKENLKGSIMLLWRAEMISQLLSIMLVAHSLSQPVLLWLSAYLTLPVKQFTIYSAPNLQYIQSNTSTQPVKISSFIEVTLTQTVNISSLHRSTDFHRRSDTVPSTCHTVPILMSKFWFLFKTWRYFNSN